MKLIESEQLPHLEMDSAVPGGVYLCQVNDTVSCGACCGLYNLNEISRNHLTGILKNRTALFRAVPRTVKDIDRFARRMASVEPGRRPFEKFHHCPFIGLIGERISRVGCLLHPLADGNHGIDFRGLSYYGGMACRTYFCPATHRMNPRFKAVLRHIADDWFFYGLVVTEKDLIESLFSCIEAKLQERLEKSILKGGAQAGKALNDLLAIKYDWPYRPKQRQTACHYFFEDGLYERPAIDYDRLSVAPSRFDTIFRALGSGFSSAGELADAEIFIDTKITAAVRQLKNSLLPLE